LKATLCIGGELDGQYVQTTNASFRAIEKEAYATTKIDDTQEELLTFNTQEYARVYLGNYSVFSLTTSSEETIGKLLKGYKKSSLGLKDNEIRELAINISDKVRSIWIDAPQALGGIISDRVCRYLKHIGKRIDAKTS